MKQDRLILRDHLALDRTRLANERTFLAYVRTAIMLLVSGVTLIKLFGTEQSALLALGYALIPMGMAAGVFGLVRFRQVYRRIMEDETPQAREEAR